MHPGPAVTVPGEGRIAGPRLPVPDFARSPLLVLWELTRACDLACAHCRAQASPGRDPGELDTEACLLVLQEIAEMGAPLVVLTGGDPLLRPDLEELVREGVRLGLRMAMTPSVTPLLTPTALERLRAAGLSRLALSLDSALPEVHDRLRGIPGTHAATLRVLEAGRSLGLSLQVNTTVTRSTRPSLAQLPPLLDGLGIDLWSVFFLVPVGRALPGELPSAADMEEDFALLFAAARRGRYSVKSTEAPHYRRFALQQRFAAGMPPIAGVNDGAGIMFIDHRGIVQPSGFLPIAVGSVEDSHVADLYRDAPLMRALRDPDLLTGKCGVCEFRRACGGSRARAYALTGDPLGSDPCCAWLPAKAAANGMLRV